MVLLSQDPLLAPIPDELRAETVDLIALLDPHLRFSRDYAAGMRP